jgi:hypothetical protein
MKKSGIFWSILLICILYYLFTISGLTLLIGYLVYHIIGIIVQLNSDLSIFEEGYYEDCITSSKVKKLFLNKPYLFLMVHLFIIGFCIVLYYTVINIGDCLSSFDDRIDKLKIVTKKEKKKSFNEYIRNE